MFYFEPTERQEIAKKKWRRKIDDERRARIKLREEEDKQLEEELRLSRIPPPEQIDLMKKTLQALNTSPSPSLLEIRILTNHGHDPRFSSFLKKDGKWAIYWESMKSDDSQLAPESGSQIGKASVNRDEPSNPNGLTGGLVDYDDSSDENESDHNSNSDKLITDNPSDPIPNQSQDPPASSPRKGNEDSPEALKIAPGEGPELWDPTKTSSEGDQMILDCELILDSNPSAESPTIAPEKTVDAAERLNRQQRAKLWAESRKKTRL